MSNFMRGRGRTRQLTIVAIALAILGGYAVWDRHQAIIAWGWQVKEQWFPTPKFSHEGTLADLTRFTAEIDDLLRSESIDRPRCERLVAVTIRLADRMLSRDDITPHHRTQVHSLLLRSLSIGVDVNQFRFKRRWEQLCSLLMTKYPQSQGASTASAHLLARRFLNQELPVSTIIDELAKHVESYPKNPLNVRLYLGVADQLLKGGRPAEAATIMREGVRNCATHPRVGVLHKRIAKLDGNLR